METAKLDRWAQELLDIGKRNNLISFKETKSNTLEVVYPDLESLMQWANGAAKKEIFNLTISEDEEEFDEPAKELAGEHDFEANGEGIDATTAANADVTSSYASGSVSTASVAASAPAPAPASAPATATATATDTATATAPSTATVTASVPSTSTADPAHVSAVNKTQVLAAYEKQCKKHDKFLVYNPYTDFRKVVRNIEKRAKEAIEETGVNIAYLAVGFVTWKEKDSQENPSPQEKTNPQENPQENSAYTYKAPLLLVPVAFESASPLEPTYLRPLDDGVIVNPTFSYKLKSEYEIALPAYDEDQSVVAYLQQVEEIVSKLNWSVLSQCRIGLFSFLKLSMYEDMKRNQSEMLESENIRALLGEPCSVPNSAGAESFFDESKRLKNPLIELHNVVDADSSQLLAIEMAKAGKSFVLQGPPGTGKSQTITNIIAECLYDGKKILFVSEKQAALSVVFEKLRKVGLSDFCLQLHSHKTNKKDFIEEIYATLMSPKLNVSSSADRELTEKAYYQRQLDDYVSELHKPRRVIGLSLFDLYENYFAVVDAPDAPWVIPDIAQKGPDYVASQVELLDSFALAAQSVSYDYWHHPWYGFAGKNLGYEEIVCIKNEVPEALDAFERLIGLGQELNSLCGAKLELSVAAVTSLIEIVTFLRCARFIRETTITFGGACEALTAQQRIYQAFAKKEATYNSLMEHYYPSILDLDCEQCERLASIFADYKDASLGKLFDANYRNAMKDIKKHAKRGWNPTCADALEAVNAVARYGQEREQFSQLTGEAAVFFPDEAFDAHTEWGEIERQLLVVKSLYQDPAKSGLIAALADGLQNVPENERVTLWEQVYAKAQEMKKCAGQGQGQNWACEQSQSQCQSQAPSQAQIGATLAHLNENMQAGVFSLFDDPFDQVIARLRAMNSNQEKLEEWLAFANLRDLLDASGLHAFIRSACESGIEKEALASAFKKLFYKQWIFQVKRESPTLCEFSRAKQDVTIAKFREKDKNHFEVSKAQIRAVVSQQRPSTLYAAAGSDVSIILREKEKSRKKKPVRTLMNEVGGLIQQIKPCFMMSPLSVSTYLSANDLRFDVIIFDEASQVFPWDAVGAIYRGKQLIVAGDSKQMPPTNFFMAATDDQEEDEEVGDVTDFESILDLCSAVLPQMRLNWHYRSRDESLIAFSNLNFYGAHLLTFPSALQAQEGMGVEYVYTPGVFERRRHTNKIEAEAVVERVFSCAQKWPEKSVGVVAFNRNQQALIENLIYKKRRECPGFDKFFDSSNEEPFFVKNLETVQGDERDIILFSTTYAKDVQGKFILNFGPLNKLGGERRLNVAVTRAKWNLQVVTSMRATDIDLTKTTAEGTRLLRDYLDFAERGSVAIQGALGVQADAAECVACESAFEEEVYECLIQAGFAVDTQVGCSGYRIDLALKAPHSSDYLLAIECDGAAYHSSANARDRDRLRQEVLERMGWKFYRIWSTDWFNNGANERSLLLKACQDALGAAAGKAAFAAAAGKSGSPCASQAGGGPLGGGQQGSPQLNSMHPDVSQPCPIRDESKAIVDGACDSLTFEEELLEDPLFPYYRTVNIEAIRPQYFTYYLVSSEEKLDDIKATHRGRLTPAEYGYLRMVRDILATEEPLSVEWLKKRTVRFFGRTKVTSVVDWEFAYLLKYAGPLSVVERKGFLYLNAAKNFELRVPSDPNADDKRPIEYIALEELAAGMEVLIRENVKLSKKALFGELATILGFARLGENARKRFDEALGLLAPGVDFEDDDYIELV